MRQILRTEPAELHETEAIRRAQRGDGAGFERLYNLHSRRVYAICLRMVANTTLAEDMVQDAFLQLFRKIQSFRGESAFSTWLHRLVVNVVLMRLRKKKLPVVSLEEFAAPDEETGTPGQDIGVPDLRLTGSLDRLNLERAIAELPEGYKTAFELHDVQGYDHSEMAKIMGCSVGNSKSQLHKARLRLRGLLHEAQRDRARQRRIEAKKSDHRGDPSRKRKARSESRIAGFTARLRFAGE